MNRATHPIETFDTESSIDTTTAVANRPAWPVRIVFLAAWFSMWVSSIVVAGTVELTGGGTLTGRVREVDQAKPAYVIVQIDDQLTLAVRDVHTRRKVVTDELIEYRQQVIAAGQDAESHYQLSRWCKQNRLLHQSRYHLTRAVDLDPNHKRSRVALGYVRDGGQWVNFETLRRSQGLVGTGRGRWVLPDVLAEEQLQSEKEVQTKRWIKTVAQLRNRAARGDAEARAELAAIVDPLAAGAIGDALNESRSQTARDRELRMMYVQMLGRFRTPVAVEALTRAGVFDSDAVVREEALRQLNDYGQPSAIATYLPMLRSNNPAEVKAAAVALDAFPPNPEMAMAYVNALITVQKTREQIGSGGTQAGFAGDGGMAFGQGSKIVERTTPFQHPEVLSLIRKIAPDVNYGFDEKAWQLYFAGQRNPSIGDLRRDP